MSLIKRIRTTINASVDRAVARVENHDAIIEAALKDTQRAAARTRVRLERVRRDGAALKKRQKDLRQASQRWADRARAVAAEDEAKALQCVSRRRDCQAELDSLTASIAQHDELEARIAEQSQQIEARVREISQQRNMMRSRQSVAEAMQTIHNVQGATVSDVEQTFDRWEVNLGETEILLCDTVAGDALEAEFRDEESAADLRAELDALMRDDAARAGDAQ